MTSDCGRADLGTNAADATAHAVLSFWFGAALADEHAVRARTKVWFRRDREFDIALAQRFADLPDRARSGALDAWMQHPQHAAARIIVLDQIPRNLFRGSPRAFAYDDLARAAALAVVAAGWDCALHPLMAAFVYLPFEHAEDASLQERAVASFEALEQRICGEAAPVFSSFSDYARRHRSVIARFGRFPHRNAVLGRASTAEELAYLAAGGERFESSPR